MANATEVTCIGCKQPFEADAFLRACSGWDAALDCVMFRCPSCAGSFEARLDSGRFWHGYVYAAGSAHFSTEVAIAAPSLVVQKTPEGLDVSWGAARRVIPPQR
jgi:hypothetical protein